MILVTGGTGFVGRAVIAELLQQRRAVRTITRRRGAALDELASCGVDVLEGDLNDGRVAGPALDRVHTVIHLAGAVEGTPAQLAASNQTAAEAIARAAQQRGVRWFVHLSSAGVYGDAPHAEPRRESAQLLATTPYECSKLAGERAVVAALSGGAVGHVVLRPAGVYGGARAATQQFLRQVAARRWWFSAPPTVIVHPTYIDDVVQAVVACLDKPELDGEVFNIAGERAMTVDAWALAVAAALDLSLHRIALPAWALSPPAQAAVALARALGLSPPQRLLRAAQPLLSRVLDTGKARKRLGFVPLPLPQALQRTIAQARELGALP
jgi:nucleoside-diphosphate-sugar epimerase